MEVMSRLLASLAKIRRLHFVKNDENKGFAEGNNIGLTYAKGAYVTLLNNDTEVDKDWLT